MTWTLTDLESAIAYGLRVVPTTGVGFKLSCTSVPCVTCPIGNFCHSRYTAMQPDLLALIQTHYPEQLL